MKKILCLTDGFSLGGAERQLIGLAFYLKCKGYEVELCSYLKRDFYRDLISAYGLNDVCLDIQGGKISKFIALFRHVKYGSYDWIIAYKDGATFSACVMKALGLKSNIIVSDRNTNISYNRRVYFKFWLFNFANFIVPNAYSQENFICNNFPKLKDKVITITNFTDTNYFKPSIVEKYDNITKIMVAARIAEQKNILRFLNVVKKLKENGFLFHVTWYGDVSSGQKEYELSCKAKHKNMKLSDVFTFKPATQDILKEYQTCDVFCLPSLYEGYPNAVCEAMSCGKPIICSRVCDNPQIVEEGVNGMMFDPMNVEDMYEVIKRFICLSQNEKKIMGMKSRELAMEKFSEESFVQKYIKIIESN